MLTISVTQPKVQLLAQLLEEAWEELRVEVRHTDRLEYKQDLQENERLIQAMLIKLESKRVKEPAG
jgi:hypothetical protein